MVSRKTKCSACDAEDECCEFATAPIRNHLVRRKILRSFQALRRHLERPRNEEGHGESKREQHHECCDDRLWCVHQWQKNRRNLNQQPGYDRISECNPENIASS